MTVETTLEGKEDRKLDQPHFRSCSARATCDAQLNTPIDARLAVDSQPELSGILECLIVVFKLSEIVVVREAVDHILIRVFE